MSALIKGQIVFSKAGRDKEQFFIVMDYVQPYAYLVDGDIRKLENPKKKKEKHIKPTAYIDEALKDLLEKHSYITNADIRKSLSRFIHEANHKQ
jgi:large subunit ribosomal protein L14e